MTESDLLNDAVKTIKSAKHMRMLLEGKIINKSRQKMYQQVLTRLFHKLYSRKKYQLAAELAILQFSAKVVPMGM